jgi:SecD/SecF fusion protein
MKRFTSKIILCVLPVALAGLMVAWAFYAYQHGQGGFKLGVDLVGGTILVYEVDPNKKLEDYKPEQMAARIKRRIDPADLYNYTVRPVGQDRVEIILRTNEEEVQRVKNLIAQAGSLEFRLLANEKDEKDAISAARSYVEDAKHKQELAQAAREGKPPSPPPPPEGSFLPIKDSTGKVVREYPVFKTDKGMFTYSWVELDKEERQQLGLDNASENEPERNGFWKRVAEARAAGKTIELPGVQGLLYSRPCEDINLPQDQREKKKYEYFVLVRDPERDPETGELKTISNVISAHEIVDQQTFQPAVSFRLDTRSGDRFYEVTSKNLPKEPGGSDVAFHRHLAIILDGKIVSAPRIQSAIHYDGQITGGFTKEKVDNLVNILRSGALPATLKPQPVSENSMGATLGSDTIEAGTKSVLWAFGAVLVFMLVYYRFSGVVACVALLANLVLTVGFMVAVNATFTLPGLAGLVLMLGMAVDANVLIYERLREERERGASLALAIRNGYDRAFPTIIDTHLSSIFTAIVLYAVGNDQLKGFGISLTAGLIISLFTSLFMTRLMFDIWLYKGWLHKLSMLRLLSKPNIDFMAIRYYWFTATIVLTIFGITVFLLRGPAGLNIDFVGGTAYSGQLVRPVAIEDLRKLLGQQEQEAKLKLKPLADGGVTPVDDSGLKFVLTYADGTRRTVELPNRSTAEQIWKDAQQLPDLSVEQIFLDSYKAQDGGSQSRFFTIRTSEKAQELVRTSIDRLLGDLQKKISMEYKIDPSNKEATLTFGDDYASPNQVKMLIKRELESHALHAQVEQFNLVGVGEGREGRFQAMKLELIAPVERAKLDEVLEATKKETAARPQPERLENFDSQLASETRDRAMYAILASWAAILLYLWFRFGNWTFGLAAVACLIHDLFFTLGIIAFCHYIHDWAPGFATMLGLQDFKIDLPAVAALLTLVGYSVNDTIVVFDRIREVRGKNPALTPQMINDSVNQTLSRTLLTAFSVWVVVIVLYAFGGEGVHLFAFVMVVGVIVGTYSSIYIASPLLLIFGEGTVPATARERQPQPEGVGV